MKYFVYWIVGSCQTGDRNAGLTEFNTLDEAEDEAEDTLKNYPAASVTVIEGTEVFVKNNY